MSLAKYMEQLQVLIESQGGERFAALALEELGLTYADEVPTHSRLYVLERMKALWEEEEQ